jgi:glycosyltransferase involved in cell wall biosynthesis
VTVRILFLTQVLPYPLDAGPKTRAYFTLRYLAQRHEVTLLSFARPSDADAALKHLRECCHAVHTVPMPRSPLRDAWHLLRSLPGATPFLIARDWVPAMAGEIVRCLAATRFAAIHADQLWMAPYALHARAAAGSGPKPALILDQHNAVFQIPRRLAAQEPNGLKRALLTLEERKLARYETDVCRRFDRVVWVTAEDRAALEERAGRPWEPARATIIPICVDPTARPPLVRQPEAYRVTFLGGLHWPPNLEGVLWFLRAVWPEVVARAPTARLTIIGKVAADARALAEAVAAAPGQVEMTGYVEDPAPYLAETAAFIVPLHAGGGMRVKIVDAWSWGLPIVATSIGAEGIRYGDGEDILIADTAPAFARAVVRLLTDRALAERLGRQGRLTVERAYDWRTVYAAWDAVYEGIEAAP